jgi:aminoglycoside N3'-acetyltransferase
VLKFEKKKTKQNKIKQTPPFRQDLTEKLYSLFSILTSICCLYASNVKFQLQELESNAKSQLLELESLKAVLIFEKKKKNELKHLLLSNFN